MELRPASNRDREAVTSVISSAYQQYGEVMCPEGADADLLDIEAAYAGRGGAFVVLVDQGEVVGCHATLPLDREQRLITFRRLYLRKDHRGGGGGGILMDWAVEWARARDYRRIEFWSDTRFERAHRFFARYGFGKTGRIRDMHDGALPYSEYEFQMTLE
jgi:putative acetyltransferase